MRGRLHVGFDFKSMGIGAYVPFVVCVIWFIYGSIDFIALHSLLRVSEYVVPLTAAWWAIFLFQDVLEEEGSETLFSYPLPRWKLGFIRVIVFFGLYVTMLLIMLLMLEFQREETLFVSLAIQFSVQAFFMAGLGFLAVVLTGHTGWSLLVVIAYTFGQYLTGGLLAPPINIYFFNRDVLDVSTVLTESIQTVILGSVCFFIGQYVLNRYKRFK